MIIIGHRGAKGLAPENTTEGIKKAIEVGVDMIEVDVREHNGTLVLSHDHAVKSEVYCSLQEALTEVGAKVPLILEIKEERVLPFLAESIQNYSGKIIISSKKFDILRQVKELLPDAEVALIEKWSGVRAVAQATFLDTKQIHINHHWLWGSFVRSMKHRGYDLYAYTVNDVERAEELQSWGVDGIFTDYPDRMNKYLRL